MYLQAVSAHSLSFFNLNFSYLFAVSFKRLWQLASKEAIPSGILPSEGNEQDSVVFQWPAGWLTVLKQTLKNLLCLGVGYASVRAILS